MPKKFFATLAQILIKIETICYICKKFFAFVPSPLEGRGRFSGRAEACEF
jgi:hypothetical protein